MRFHVHLGGTLQKVLFSQFKVLQVQILDAGQSEHEIQNSCIAWHAQTKNKSDQSGILILGERPHEQLASTDSHSHSKFYTAVK